jgi:hypothetical protein
MQKAPRRWQEKRRGIIWMTTSLLKNQAPTPIARLDYEVQRFADLAVLCHDSRSRLKTMALITACGDESSDKDQRVLAVGAFVGPADEWTALLLDWIERIKPETLPSKINAFHRTDCETGQGEFPDKFGWTEESRKRLIIDLIEIITRRRVLLCGAGLQMKDYGNLELIDGKPVGKSEYHVLLQAIMGELSWQREDSNAPSFEDIAYVFDQQDRAREFWAHEIHKETKNHPKISWKNRIGTLTFGDKKSTGLLQVADLGTYEVMRHITNYLFFDKKPRKSFEAFAATRNVAKIVIYDGKTLEKIVESKKAELAASFNDRS